MKTGPYDTNKSNIYFFNKYFGKLITVKFNIILYLLYPSHAYVYIKFIYRMH
jgi:hypothetical protein